MSDLEGAVLAYQGGKRSAQVERREWRTKQRKQRAADPRPPGDKVVHPRRLVDVAPAVKKGRAK